MSWVIVAVCKWSRPSNFKLNWKCGCQRKECLETLHSLTSFNTGKLLSASLTWSITEWLVRPWIHLVRTCSRPSVSHHKQNQVAVELHENQDSSYSPFHKKQCRTTNTWHFTWIREQTGPFSSRRFVHQCPGCECSMSLWSPVPYFSNRAISI